MYKIRYNLCYESLDDLQDVGQLLALENQYLPARHQLLVLLQPVPRQARVLLRGHRELKTVAGLAEDDFLFSVGVDYERFYAFALFR